MNSIGHIFKVLTWGESHGIAMGVVVDGCPAGLFINEENVQKRLEDDIPDLLLGTARHEPNPFIIVSGISHGVTIGTPIAILIPNIDVQSSPYKKMESSVRPGHGDFTYRVKYGHVDPKGGGRASGRECISRLAAGEIARQLIEAVYPDVSIKGTVTEMAGVKINDQGDYLKAQQSVIKIAEKGDSTGGEVSLVIRNLPAGIGSPVFDKLEARFAQAIMSIGAVKSFEIGIGKKAKEITGSLCNDSFMTKRENGSFRFGTKTNNAGGLLAGISNGEEILITLSVKPTPTIKRKQSTVDWQGNEVEVSYNGRYDKNITPRIVPIAQSMIEIILADELISGGFIHPTNIKMSSPVNPFRMEILKEKIYFAQNPIAQKNNYSKFVPARVKDKTGA